MRLCLMIGAIVALAGGAQARIQPFGHRPAEVGKAGDERVCTTTTTVVRRGDVVLSTSSATRCEDPGAAATLGASPSSAVAAEPPGSAGTRPGKELGGPGVVARLFGAVPLGLKPRDVLGVWTAIERGKKNACTVRMTREVSSDGFRVLAGGCQGVLGGVKAWRFDQTEAGLYGAGGALLARLTGDREHLTGASADGGMLSFTR